MASLKGPLRGLRLRVRRAGMEWKMGREPKMGKNGRKIIAYSQSGKNRPKMATTCHFPIFGHFWAIFPRVLPWAFFLFFGLFFPFSASARFHSIPACLTCKSMIIAYNPCSYTLWIGQNLDGGHFLKFLT